VVEEVIRRAKELTHGTVPVIACPDVPENDIFVDIAERAGVRCYKGSTTDVLDRLLGACRVTGSAAFTWLQGIHFLLDVPMMNDMTEWALRHNYDYARVPDGSCKLTMGQFVTARALQQARCLTKQLPAGRRELFRARPLAFLRTRPDLFATGMYDKLPEYTDEQLRRLRRVASLTLKEERASHTELGCAVGDASLGRYRELLPFLPSGGRFLDVACGTGYGSRSLSGKAGAVVGVDVSEEVIRFARIQHGDRIDFRVGRAEHIPAQDQEFDAVVSVATIEHVKDDRQFVHEMARVLKRGGKAVIYTPQNRIGKIPIWPWHEREYSVEWLTSLVSTSFSIEKVIGWQNGAMTPDEDTGEGMFLIAQKRC
jgi:2-polyprenyl-3-methyl-5-hydroxy-6-metoxy-1,4-benzoquinol methylase